MKCIFIVCLCVGEGGVIKNKYYFILHVFCHFYCPPHYTSSSSPHYTMLLPLISPYALPVMIQHESLLVRLSVEPCLKWPQGASQDLADIFITLITNQRREADTKTNDVLLL